MITNFQKSDARQLWEINFKAACREADNIFPPHKDPSNNVAFIQVWLRNNPAPSDIPEASFPRQQPEDDRR